MSSLKSSPKKSPVAKVKSLSPKKSPVAKSLSPKKSPVKSPVKKGKTLNEELKRITNKFTFSNLLKFVVVMAYVGTAYLNFDQYTTLLELESMGIDVVNDDEAIDIKNRIISYTVIEVGLIGIRVVLSAGSNFSFDMTCAILAGVKWSMLTIDSAVVDAFVTIVSFFAVLFGNEAPSKAFAIRQITIINGMLSALGAVFTLVPLSRLLLNISLALLSLSAITSQFT